MSRALRLVLVAVTVWGFCLASPGAASTRAELPPPGTLHLPGAGRPGLGAQTQSQNMEVVGQLGGTVQAVTVDRNLAFVGVGPRLEILDVSNSAAPVLLGRSPILQGLVQAVAVAGDTAYVGDGLGLRILNVSNRRNPILVGSYNFFAPLSGDVLPSTAAVAVRGNQVYVATGLRSPALFSEGYVPSAALRVLDVSRPAAPMEVSRHAIPGESPAGLAVAGNYAYLATRGLSFSGGGALRVVDVSDPGRAREAAVYEAPAPYGLALAGGYAYLATTAIPLDNFGPFGTDLRIIDLANPLRPAEVGRIFTDDGVVYEPYWPSVLMGVSVEGNFVYVLDERVRPGGLAFTSRLRIVDVSNPTRPTESGSYLIENAPAAVVVAVASNYTYLTDGVSLRIINVANPRSLAPVGSYRTTGSPGRIALAGGRAYLADAAAATYGSQAPGRLSIVSVSSPSAPSPVGSYEFGFRSDIEWVTVTGSHAYVVASSYSPAGRTAALYIIDVSNPERPVVAGSYPIPEPCASLAVAGTRAYLTVDRCLGSGPLAVHVVDVANPARPALAGSYQLSGAATGLAVAGRYAYVIGIFPDPGLRVLDVSDSNRLMQLGSYRLPGGTQVGSVAVSGNHAYVTTTDSSPYGGASPVALRVLDVSNPARPFEVGSYEDWRGLGSRGGSLVVGNGLAYTTALGGLRVLDVSTPARPALIGYHEGVGGAGLAVADNHIHVAAVHLGLVILRFTGSASGSATIGGRGFALASWGSSSLGLSWAGGAQQTAYVLFRLSPTGIHPIPLSAGATGYVDSPPAKDLSVCYLLHALGGAASLAASDLLCAVRLPHRIEDPSGFTIRLNQGTTATLSWARSFGQTERRYVLAVLGTARVQVLGPNATETVDNTGGVATCYVLLALSGTTVTGLTDVLCGVPGRSAGFQ